MTEKRNMTEEGETNDAIEKLQSAITKLILDLKGDGTVSSLADRLNVSRNRLAEILKPYKEPDEEEEKKEQDASNSQGKLKAKRLYWDLVPLIRIAHALKISVSKLIEAAEDVQDGLPPWFQMRITRDTKVRTSEELVNVFLEAVGCRTYGPRDPLNVKGQRKLRNHYRRELMPGDDLEVFFSEIDVSQMKFFAKYLFEDRFLKEIFLKHYHEGKFSSKDAYRILKQAVDLICSMFSHHPRKKVKDPLRIEAVYLLEHLDKNKAHLIDAITCEYREFLQAKGSVQNYAHI